MGSSRQETLPLSIAAVALLFPWITVIVIAERFPEARRVPVRQAQAADPLGALPEVEVWHDQPRWAAVLRRQRLILVPVRDERLAALQVRHGQVRRISAVAPHTHVPGRWIRLDVREQRINAYSGPVRVELAPFRHAVDVHDKRLRRKLQEVVPRPRGGLTHQTLDRQRPAIKRSVGRWPSGEDWEIADDVLAGWDTVR